MKQKNVSLYRKIMEKFRSISIRCRLNIICIFVCVVPVVTIGFFAYTKYEKSIVLKLSQTTGEVLKLLDKNLTTEMKRFDYIGNQILISDIVQENLLNYSELSELEKREISLQLNESFNEKITISEMVKGIYILDVNKDIFYSMGYEVVDENSLREAADAAEKSQPLEYMMASDGVEENDNIIISKVIYSADGSAVKKGYFILVIDEKTLKQKTYQDIDIGKNAEFFILNTEGKIISALDNEIKIGELYPQKEFVSEIHEKQKNREHSFVTEFRGKEYIAIFKYHSESRWYLVSLLSSEYINSEVQEINFVIGLLCILFICVCYGIVSLIMMSIEYPIKKLVRMTEIVASGEYPEPIRDTNKDELAYLTVQFDEMVTRIRELKTKENEINDKKREMEIKMLQTQINPHFLFNTLSSLKWIAVMSRVQIVADGIDALAQLLKGTLSDTRELIRLRDEIQYLDQYFLIQKLRYGDSFEVKYEIDENMRDLLIIKFLLQPLVENAIIHGANCKKEKLHILIKAEIEKDCLFIYVEDDGVGFDVEEFYKRTKEKKKHRGMSGIGLSNVQERIQLNFGKNYTMQIESGMGNGTKIILTLPVVLEEGENDSV